MKGHQVGLQSHLFQGFKGILDLVDTENAIDVNAERSKGFAASVITVATVTTIMANT
jgi:hypothetical protein